MKALITGGSGFIGTYLSKRLSTEHVEVTIFDKRSPCAETQKFCKFVGGDLLELDQVKNAIADFDVVYHLAANADISIGAKNTSIDLQLTTIATYNVLEAMRVNSVQSIVFLSGSGVYGKVMGDTPATEDSGPLLPVSLYGANKLAAEGLISAFANMFDMRAIILRPANIVGGGQTHGVLFDFLRKLKHDNRRLEILGDGNQTKSYLHVDDLFRAIKTAQAAQIGTVSLFNVASADLVDVNWIANTVIERLGLTDVKISHTGGKVGWIGDVAKIRLDTSKLEKLGWTPQFTSKQAINKALSEMLTSEK